MYDCMVVIDQGARMHEGALYCAKDYAAMVAHKCCVCTEAIVEGQPVTLQGKTYHQHCYACADCNTSLLGKEVFASRAGDGEAVDGIFCRTCYADRFAKKCAGCTRPLVEGSVLTVLGKDYHADCLACAVCRTSVRGMAFFESADGQLVCGDCE